MLGFIPKPLPDEILYSVLARAQTLALYNSPGQLSIAFFGKRRIPATIDLPSHIHYFHERVKEIFPFSEDQIIEKFTLWRYYYPFLVCSKRERAIELIKGENGWGLHNLIGINPSSMTRNKGLKYCPACTVEDRINLGLTYWHRVHQIPDLLLCPRHKCYLVRYVGKAKDHGRSVYIDANQVDLTTQPIQQESNLRLIDLSEQMSSILYGHSSFDINRIDYKTTIEKSVFQKGSQIDKIGLVKSFTTFYEGVLDRLLPGISTHWIIGIIKRPNHFFSPVRHLMMDHFLSQTKSRQVLPPLFGKGPWKCINKAANHFGEEIITNISYHFDHKTRKQIARLACECGMVYTKSLLSENIEFTRIIEWGSIWKNLLKRELGLKRSFRNIAKTLGTDAKTVSRYASKLATPEKNISPGRDGRAANRNKWKKLLNKFEYSKVICSRKQNPALYIWLYRHDKKWLLQINKQNSFNNPQTELRLDWKSLDKRVMDLIIEAAEGLKEENYKGRITKSLISKIISAQHYLLGKHVEKLPLSHFTLKLNVESKEGFHERRILGVMKELESTNQLKRWRIIRKASLGRNISESSKNLIEKHLKYAN